MTRIKILGLALVAVFAFAAIGVASASANPGWYSCGKAAKNATTKMYEGHYTGKYCEASTKVETGGKYELIAGIGKGKAAKSSTGEAVLHSINPEAHIDIPVTCGKSKGGFQPAAPNFVTKAVTVFEKCKALSAPCSNGAKEKITTKSLAGELVWLSKAGGVVGTVLYSEAAPGGPVAEFTCEALGEIHTSGAVIAQNAGDVKAVSKEGELVFAPGKFLGNINEKGEACKGAKEELCWEPIVNIPEYEGSGIEILKTEVKGSITGHPEEFYPKGGIPSGQEGVVKSKGEALGIY